MKKIIFSLIFATLFPSPSYSMDQRVTTCNLRYNNRGIIAKVPCRAGFESGSLKKVDFLYLGQRYSWQPDYRSVTRDSRWRECIRYTFPEGNQWQICTEPSPEQLGIVP